ncbi:MAG: ABC transporter substrate-binding protein [Clostridiales bacterium]|nr:ABC transporter substrate-binding protein [Clostridiales bacterium]
MKKLLPLLLSLILLTGCGGKTVPSGGQEAPLVAGIIQLTENESFSDMREGFIERMRELGYGEDEMEFLCRDAGGSMATLNTICQSMVAERVDLLVPIVTSATQAVVSLDSDIPVIFISVTDPVSAGIMTSMDVPDKNATGTSNEVPVEALFALAEQLTPGIKTCGILYNTGLTNSVVTAARAKAYFDAAGISCIERVVTSSAEVQRAAADLCAKADAIYVPIDSTVLAAMPQVAEAAKEAGVPVYGSAPSMVSYGALATVSVSERETGRRSADLADLYFQGTPIAEIPAVVADDFLTVINVETARALGVTIPEDVADNAALIGG